MYCYVGDLLGFQDTILNLGEEEQKIRVEEWIKLVTSVVEKCDHIDNTHCHFVSDTVFIGAEASKDGLVDLLNASKNLMENGISNSFLVRGAIAFGKVRWDSKVTFGEAIVRAYNLANNQNWIGTACDLDLPDINLLYNFDEVFVYSVPLKRGIIQLFPVVSWNVPGTNDLTRLATWRGLTRFGEGLTWEKFGYKIQNTRLFSSYLKKIKEIELKGILPKPKPSEFYGYLPMELVEMDL